MTNQAKLLKLIITFSAGFSDLLLLNQGISI